MHPKDLISGKPSRSPVQSSHIFDKCGIIREWHPRIHQGFHDGTELFLLHSQWHSHDFPSFDSQWNHIQTLHQEIAQEAQENEAQSGPGPIFLSPHQEAQEIEETSALARSRHSHGPLLYVETSTFRPQFQWINQPVGRNGPWVLIKSVSMGS